jgi:hypothetical protein
MAILATMSTKLTPAIVAAMWAVSVDTVRRAAKRGEFAGARKNRSGRGGQWEIPAESAENWTPRRRGRPRKSNT